MVKSAGTCIVNDSGTIPTKAMANVKLHFSEEVYESHAKLRGRYFFVAWRKRYFLPRSHCLWLHSAVVSWQIYHENIFPAPQLF